MSETTFESDEAFFTITNNILIGSFKSKIVDLNMSKKITTDRVFFQKGNSYPIISNIKQVKTVTKDARDFLASEEGCEGVVAAAVLIDSVIGSMIGNFFIRISKPLRPTRIFTNEQDALKWLEQYKKNNN